MKQFYNFLFFFFIAVRLTAAGDFVAKNSEKVVKAIRLADKIKLDGKLDEKIWLSQPITGFIQREPNEGDPVSEETRVWIAYDDSYLYVAGRLEDSNPTSIDDALFRRDTHRESDWMFVFIDPYMDKRTGYYFAVNAGGSVMDGILYNDSWDDDSWDGKWEAEVDINDDGWCFEMRIPFSQLRFNETDKMKWGINFNRDIKRNKESSFLVMVPRGESGFVSHFATLEGLDGIHPKQRFEVTPYVVQKAQYLVHDPDDPFYKSNQYETTIGGDFKIGLGSNFTIDATVNPDFGQVEVDPAVVNLSAFETYYSEKRPFFVEGSNIFSFGYGGANNNWGFNFSNPRLFYSRRIGRSPQGSTSDYQFADYPGETPIIAAGKVTGKISDGWSLGAITSVTAKTKATLYNDDVYNDEEVEPVTHYGVLRSQKEFNDGKQALGMIFTSTNRFTDYQPIKEGLVKDAFAFGLDGWSFLDDGEHYVVTGNFSGSYVHGTKEAMQAVQEKSYRYFQRPDGHYYDSTRTDMAGFAGRFMLNKQDGNFYINSAIGAVSPGFEYNDLGFQYWSDKINFHTVLGYKWHKPDSTFRNKNIFLAHYRDYNFDGDIFSNGFMLFTNMQFLNYYGLSMDFDYGFKSLDRSKTRGGPIVESAENWYFGIDGYTDSRKDLMFWAGIGVGGDAFDNYWRRVSLEMEWKPSSQLNIAFEPTYRINYNRLQWIDNYDDPTAVNTYDTRYVFGTIDQKTVSADIRVNWTFTPELSLQLYLQPLISVGKYSEFKELAKPRSMDYNIYGENGSTISFDAENNQYIVYPEGSEGEAESLTFDNPDFNYKSLRGNMVLRYEILPGSIFYFVWSHDKSNDKYPGDMDFARDFRNLWNSRANNIYMIKFSYWFDV